MKKQEMEQRIQIITKLLMLYDKGGDDGMIASYVDVLKDLPVEVLQAACKKLSMESEYRPTPATIIKAAKNLVAEANGTNTLPFAQVWEEIMQQLHDTYFEWEKPKFSRKEIEQLVNAMGGLRELRMMETKEVPIIRAQAKAMYEGICQRNAEKEANGYILGTTVLIDAGTTVRLIK